LGTLRNIALQQKKLLLSLRFVIRSFIANSQLNLTIFTGLHSFNTALAAHSIDQLFTIFVPLPFLHFHPQPFANLRRFGLKIATLILILFLHQLMRAVIQFHFLQLLSFRIVRITSLSSCDKFK